MPFGGVVVNRVRPLAPTPPTVDLAALAATLGDDEDLAARAVRALHEMRALAERDAAGLRRLAAALEEKRPILVPQLDRDVSDMAGLATIQRFLFARPRERSALLAEQAF